MEEAGFSISTTLIDDDGLSHIITFRASLAIDWKDAMKARGEFMEAAKSKGWRTNSSPTHSPTHSPQQAVTANNTPSDGDFIVIDLVSIVKGVNEANGKMTYKGRGGIYMSHGIRIWDETLPVLGVDADGLKYGENQLDHPIRVRVLMGMSKENKRIPLKIIGLA